MNTKITRTYRDSVFTKRDYNDSRTHVLGEVVEYFVHVTYCDKKKKKKKVFF